MTIRMHEADGLKVRVTVSVDPGDGTPAAQWSPLDLTGAEIEAAAGAGAAVVPGTVSVVDAEGGVFDVTFAEGAFTRGGWSWQVRVHPAGELPQTVLADGITVLRSVQAA